MKLAIVGAGATGGFLGARLAMAGLDVVLIARGPHLAAMRRDGLRLHDREGDRVVRPELTGDLTAVRGADYVFLTVKAHSLPELAPRLGPLLGPDTALVPAQNGLPWWYFDGAGGELEGTRLESVDPGGLIAASLPTQRVIGCVAYTASSVPEPGVVQHVEGNRFSLGEPDGSRSQRVLDLSAALQSAGLKAPVSDHIRREIWLKLLGNATLNPVSALTRATMAEMTSDPVARELLLALMREVDQVARAVGIEPEVSVERRLEGSARVGAHKTSMLQDVEAGRRLEVEPLIGSVVELGSKLGLELPHLRAVYACTRLLDRTLRAG